MSNDSNGKLARYVYYNYPLNSNIKYVLGYVTDNGTHSTILTGIFLDCSSQRKDTLCLPQKINII